VTAADLAIIAALIFVWGTLSARLERFDMTAPIVFTAAGVLLTHGPLRPLGVKPSGSGQGAGGGHPRPGAVL
jgi:sodium/hydrogen antiporter